MNEENNLQQLNNINVNSSISNECNTFVTSKITKIESALYEISKQLNSEILSRKHFEENSKKNENFLHQKINNLESTFSHYDVEISKTFENLHNNISNDMNIKNNALIKYLESFKASYPNNLKYNINDADVLINQPNVKYDKYIKNEFMQYRTELNTLLTKLSFTEINFDKKFEDLSKEIQELKQDISLIRSTIDDISTHYTSLEDTNIQFKSEVESNFKQINEQLTKIINLDITKQGELLNSLSSKYQNLLIQSEKNVTEIKNKIQTVDDELNKKMRQLKETLIKQLNTQNKEIDHFETHILSEYENFMKIVRISNEENITKMKSYFEYSKEDVELIRNKNTYIENSVNKLRSDIYNTIQETEKFILSKFENFEKNSKF